MATYYVSIQRGLDTNNGTSPSTPWASITKSVTTAVAGDIVYIGSGTYYEKLTNPRAGTSGNPIQFIGDPDSQFVLGDSKGTVRVTAVQSSNGQPIPGTNNVVWTKNYDYITIKNMVIDGNGFGYCVIQGTASTGLNGRVCENIIVTGYSGIQYGTCNNCISLGCYAGFSSCTNTNCVSLGGNSNFGGGTASTCYNCLTIGGYVGYNGGYNYNCISIGSYNNYYGASSTTMYNYNCLAVGGYYGFYNGTNYTCIAQSNNYAYYSSSVNYCVVDANCKANCYANKTGGTIGGSGAAAIVSTYMTLWNLNSLQKIIEACEPYYFEALKQTGYNTIAFPNNYDILGRLRRMIGGTSYIDIGSYAFSNISADYVNTYSAAENVPGVSISQIGQKQFKIPVRANIQASIKVWVKANSTTSLSLLPQISVKGESPTPFEYSTSVSTNNVWQQLTVTTTPTKDEVWILTLYAKDSAAGSISYFSDITVS